MRLNPNNTKTNGGTNLCFRKLPLVIAATFFTGTIFQGHAQESEATSSLDSTVVEAVKPAPRPAPVRRPAPAPAPAPVPVVEQEPLVINDSWNREMLSELDSTELELINATDLATTYRRNPSVTVNGGRNQGQQIFVNNLESTLLNVTVDGASQANLSHHQSSTLIDPELLKRVDVIAGGGTALDGPGALGGSIKFETKNAFALLQCGEPVVIADAKQPVGKSFIGKQPLQYDTKEFGGYLKGTGYSNGEGARGSGAIYGLINDNWGYLLSGSYTDRDSYEDGNGNTVPNTDFTSENFLFKLSGRSDTGHSLDFGYEYFSDDTLAYDRVNIDPAFLLATGRPLGLLQRLNSQRRTTTLNYDFNPEWNDAVNVETNFFYTEQSFERQTSREMAEVATFGLDIRNTTKIGNFETTYGFDYQDKDANSTYAFRAPGGNEQESIFGAYIQNTLPLNDLLSLGFGARFDDYDYTDISGQEYQSSDVSPNVALTISPIKNFSLTAGHSEAYRGVGIREAFFPGVRAPDLDGEESETQKLSYRYDAGMFYSSGSVFKQSIDNFLYPNGARGTGSLGDIRNEGYEFEVGLQKEGFHASVGVFHSEPEVLGYDYPDDLGMVVAGRRWVADVGYTFENIGVTVGWTAEIRESVDEVPLPGGGPFPAIAAKDAYTVNHLYVAWNVPACEGLSATLNVDNIFDEFYQDHTIYTGSGLASPGREVRLGLKYQF